MINGWDHRIVTWAGCAIGALALLFALPSLALWILLALAVGLVIYCYAQLLRNDDLRQPKNGEEHIKPLQNAHEWDNFAAARHRYERDIEAWMSPEELSARRGY